MKRKKKKIKKRWRGSVIVIANSSTDTNNSSWWSRGETVREARGVACKWRASWVACSLSTHNASFSCCLPRVGPLSGNGSWLRHGHRLCAWTLQMLQFFSKFLWPSIHFHFFVWPILALLCFRIFIFNRLWWCMILCVPYSIIWRGWLILSITAMQYY